MAEMEREKKKNFIPDSSLKNCSGRDFDKEER